MPSGLSNSGNEGFLESVEAGDSRVYHEETDYASLRRLAPFTVGFAVSFSSFCVYPLLLESLSLELVFVLVLSPIIIGTLISAIYLRKASQRTSLFRLRGLSRNQLSLAIFFLDMIHEGQADVGRIIDLPKPEEFSSLSTYVFGSTMLVLNRTVPDYAKYWRSVLGEKLAREVSFKDKLLIRTTVYGTFFLIALFLGFVVLIMIGMVDDSLILPVALVLVSGMFVLVGVLAAYAIRASKSEVPEGVLAAISEPDVRMETERTLDKLFEVLQNECNYPLRVLVMGEHRELVYTRRVYRTSKGFELKAAVLNPQTSIDSTHVTL